MKHHPRHRSVYISTPALCKLLRHASVIEFCTLLTRMHVWAELVPCTNLEGVEDHVQLSSEFRATHCEDGDNGASTKSATAAIETIEGGGCGLREVGYTGSSQCRRSSRASRGISARWRSGAWTQYGTLCACQCPVLLPENCARGRRPRRGPLSRRVRSAVLEARRPRPRKRTTSQHRRATRSLDRQKHTWGGTPSGNMIELCD